MLKKCLVLVSVTGLVGSVAFMGCSSVATTPSADVDSGKTTATDAKAATDSKPGTGGDGSSTADASTDPGTTGKACKDDNDCNGGSCSNGISFTNFGSLMADPYCMSDCTVVDPTKIEGCDQDRGICTFSGGKAGPGLCVGTCGFDATGIVKGEECVGINDCSPYGFGLDKDKKPFGIGICYGGCEKDADCKTAGEVCQVEARICVTTKNLHKYSKAIGAPCVASDENGDGEGGVQGCNCLYNSKTAVTAANREKGYCTKACKTGGTNTCGAGFACTSGSPTTTSATPPEALFAQEIPGVQGSCAKSCTTDTDCTPTNTFCTTVAGGKFCFPDSKK